LHISATTTEESAVGGDTSAPATKTVSIRESDVPAPAEVAGSPLNLALTDPSGAPGRSGDDTLSGGSGDNTFVFKATMDSQPGTSHFDTFTHFVHNPDHIDLTAIAGTTLVEGPVAITDTVAAHTGWFVDNAHNQRIVEVNTTATADHVNLEIHLTGSNINLSGADILHHT
jgi:Peptidase M10 serralysin C terminal